MTDRPVDTYVSIPAEAAHLAGRLVAALERAWAAIRDHHPELPAAVVILGAGSTASPPAPSSSVTSPRPAGGTASATCPRCLSAAKACTGAPVRCSAPCCTKRRTASRTPAASRTPGARVATTTAATPRAPPSSASTSPGPPASGWSATTVPATTAERYRGVLDDLAAALTLWRRRK